MTDKFTIEFNVQEIETICQLMLLAGKNPTTGYEVMQAAVILTNKLQMIVKNQKASDAPV